LLDIGHTDNFVLILTLAQGWTDSQLESSKYNWLRRSNSIRALGDRSAIHLVRYTRLLHFRAGASRLARCSEPRYRIRGRRAP
jgi:hypothetical protein